MEQRKDLKIQPVQVASTDPAFITGLMASGDDEPKQPGDDVARDQSERDDAAEAAHVDDTDETGGTGGTDDAGGQAAADTADADATSDDATSEADVESDADPGAEHAPDPDRPVFEAIDHRGSIVIDEVGVRFTLDDQEAEWTWSEIAAVEYATSRFGRRLTVTVHTPDRRWYPDEVQAPSKSTLKMWTSRLDEILDAYFEDEGDGDGEAADKDGAEAENKADTDAENKADADAGDEADQTVDKAEAGTEEPTESAEATDAEKPASEKPAAKKTPAKKSSAKK